MSTSVPPPGYEAPVRTYVSAPVAEADAPPAPRPASAPRRSAARGTRARVAAAVASGLVAVGVAYVMLGFGSTSGPVNDAIAQAATLSSAAPGYKLNMGLSITVPGLSTPVFASGRAIVDERDQAASMDFTMDLSQAPQAEQALGSTSMRFAMIIEGGVMYMKFPGGLGASVPSLDGKWLKMDISKLSRLRGLASLNNSPGMSDPSNMLQYLRAASDSISNEGPQVVNGVATTHYSAMLSLDRLAANVPASNQATVQRALSQLEQSTGMHAFPINVWIDAHHLVRRMSMSMSMHGPGGAPIQEDMTVDLYDYGPQTKPTPPPADQVADLSSLTF